MSDITTTLKFPYKRKGIDTSFTLTSNAYPTTVGTAEAGKLELRMQEVNLTKGDYELTLSGLAVSDNLLNIPTGRYSMDGGSTWVEFTNEVDVVSVGKPFVIRIPMVGFSGATTDYVLQFKKSLVTDAVSLTNCDITMKRVG